MRTRRITLFNRLSTLVLNSNVRMERDDIIRYIRLDHSLIVVQLKKSDAAGGRGVSEIYFADG
ncbi:hypothetical protein ACOJBO_03850 [Rhizobium beringeri]